jgi:CheY-like chemotaxis protein
MKTYLIDDDNLATYLTEHLLRTEGFFNTICTFQSAGEALENLVKEKQEAKPSVVFLDLNMPVMNG